MKKWLTMNAPALQILDALIYQVQADTVIDRIYCGNKK